MITTVKKKENWKVKLKQTVLHHRDCMLVIQPVKS